MSTLWLVFPAYNEEKNLKTLLPELDRFIREKIRDYKILIINDGSSDATKDIAKCLDRVLPISVISHETNKGVGEVFKTAFSSIAKMAGPDDLVIVLEADGTSDYTLIPEIAQKLRDGNDIIIASRYIKGGSYKNFPLKRHMISLVGNIILRFAIGNKKIKDYTIFYRGYKAGLIKEALTKYKDGFITSKTFLANTEMLGNLTRLTDKISEIPFVYSYDRKIGKSKMPLMRTLVDYIKFLIVKQIGNRVSESFKK